MFLILLITSIHYWIQVLCRVPEALGKGYIALGKGFAECPGGTQQREATVTAPVPLTVTLPSVNPAGTRQRFF